jgi:hypothetical protein
VNCGDPPAGPDRWKRVDNLPPHPCLCGGHRRIDSLSFS